MTHTNMRCACAYSSINCIKTSKIKRVASENLRAPAVGGGHMALPTATAQLSTEYFTVSFTYCVPQPAPVAAVSHVGKMAKTANTKPRVALQQASWVGFFL